MTDQKKIQGQDTQKISRRNVLKAAVAAGGAATSFTNTRTTSRKRSTT
jgi:hypothetical protein